MNVLFVLDGTLVTRDLKRLLVQTWIGAKPDCKQVRQRNRECLDCGGVHLPALSFHALRHSCASLLLAAGVPMRDVSRNCSAIATFACENSHTV